MSQVSEWWEIEEIFELHTDGVISFLLRELSFLNLCINKAICKYEKNIINKAKIVLGNTLNKIMNFESNFTMDNYEEMMMNIYRAIKAVVDFLELEVLN